MAGKYDELGREQLIALLEKRDREKKLGLVWERDEIEADAAIDQNFVACEIVPELSEKAAPWRNLVIEGDNYDALRWLRMTHRGKVKAIYIDPPYNTGNKDWVYNDHYIDRDDRYRHSTWLEFLYRRLTLARDLLADDGVILVSINDEQRAKLELLMDEALPGMRVGSLVWRTRTGGNEGGEHFMSDNHEHVLVYANKAFLFGGTEKTFDMYRHWDESRQDWYRHDNLTQSKTRLERPNSFFPLQDPATGVWYPPNPDAVWRFVSASTSSGSRTQPIEALVAESRIAFPVNAETFFWATREELVEAIRLEKVPKSGRSLLLREDLPNLDFWIGRTVGAGTPAYKRYKSDLRNATQPLSSWITPRAELSKGNPDDEQIVSGTNDEGAKIVKDVFGEKTFNYAKPVSLIRELLRQSTSPGDLVLDFFAGSATTAQAVMELNAEDGGDRRFIMVSSTEATEDAPDKNLCRDVTSERIRRLNAAEGKYAELAADFAYLRTAEIDFEDLDYDLRPDQAWTVLEALHGLPLTPYEAGRGWNAHEGEDTVLVLVDQADAALAEWVAARTKQNLFVYGWAPGQVESWLGGLGVSVLPVRQTLVRRFMA